MPFVILGVPIVDTVFAIIRRTVHRTGVAVRDLEHLHHRLMRLGHGHRRTVIVLWIWTFLLSALVLYPTFYPSWGGAIPIGFLVMAAALYTLFLPGLRRTPRSRGRTSAAQPIGPADAAAEAGCGRGAPLARPVALAGHRPWPARRTATEAASGDARREPAAGGHRGQHRRRFARHHPPTQGWYRTAEVSDKALTEPATCSGWVSRRRLCVVAGFGGGHWLDET